MEENTNKQAHTSSSTRSTILKLYVIASYLIIWGATFNFYRQKRNYEKVEQAIENALSKPSLESWRKAWNASIDDESGAKIRSEEEVEEAFKKLIIGCVFAPIALPYFLLNGFPSF